MLQVGLRVRQAGPAEARVSSGDIAQSEMSVVMGETWLSSTTDQNPDKVISPALFAACEIIPAFP